jgi:hypothetical protein
MTEALVFNTRPKESHVPDVEFTLDEREYTAQAPKKAAWGVLVGAINNRSADSFQAAMAFLDACLDIPDQMFLERRLRDRDDHLDIDDLLEIVEALCEEWEPYLGEEFGELSGENRTRRRQRSRTAKKAATPARRPAPAKKA